MGRRKVPVEFKLDEIIRKLDAIGVVRAGLEIFCHKCDKQIIYTDKTMGARIKDHTESKLHKEKVILIHHQ